jgi:GT2 family glycosyltransferase
MSLDKINDLMINNPASEHEKKSLSLSMDNLKIISEEDSIYPNLSINAIAFMKPVELTLSAWLEHIPFAFWLTNAHRPRVFVELGTHYGSSYFAFCQAIEQLRLSTRSYAVDAWKGDEHAGFYEEDVYSSVQAHNTKFYSRFSNLMRMNFDEAVKYFEEGEIDLLHIDGFHTYEAVKNDFETWLPRMSKCGVVIIHDSNERKKDFGVYRYVEELRKIYPCFEFAHGHGLTIVGVGENQSASMLQLFSADSNEREIHNIQEVFSRLGKAYLDEYNLNALKSKLHSVENERDNVTESNEQLNLGVGNLQTLLLEAKRDLTQKNADLVREVQQNTIAENEIARLQNEVQKTNEILNLVSTELNNKENDIRIILSSTSWRITAPVRFTKDVLRYVKRKFNRGNVPSPVLNTPPQAYVSEINEFDPQWYLLTYPDIASSGVDPYEHFLVHGKDEGRYPSEKALLRAQAPDLDEEWYLETYSDVKNAGLSALYHYISHGRKEGRFPSLARLHAQDFDSDWYLNEYPDVAAIDMEPLNHFLHYGYSEGRKPCAMPRMLEAPYFRYGPSEYGARGKPLLIDADVNLNKGFSHTIGVHLHLYYIDLSDEFISHLKSIPTKFDLFISIPKGKYNIDECKAHFCSDLKLLNKLEVRETENIGRDIFPFIVEFGKELLSYDVILHIHSKKSPQTKTKGWRRFLLHYTLGSRSITTQILNAFNDDEKLGAFFPAYFYGTTRQPLWGGNGSIVQEQLDRLGFNYDMNYCPDYPAGSFFWARSEALRPLLDGQYNANDFDNEAGQFDGTLAHGFERLFGVIPLVLNYTTNMSFVDRDYRLTNYYDRERFAQLPTGTLPHFEQDRSEDIHSYKLAVKERKEHKARIALVTAIIGSFDALLLPKYFEENVDYFCFSDTVTDGYGLYHLQTPPYIDADPRRTARYIKTNLLKYIKGYDYVVWIDANVELKIRVTDLVQQISSSTHKLGAIKHPLRDNLFDEAEEILAWDLDDPDTVTEQIKRYQSIEILQTDPLIESNVLVMDAREERIHDFMRLWWNEINNHSRRDQLSIGYALSQAGVTWLPLLDESESVRDSNKFALYRHGLNEWGPKPHIYASWYKPCVKESTNVLPNSLQSECDVLGSMNLDIVICIHNALDDVRACLASLDGITEKANIILVDDASGLDTKHFLEEYSRVNGAKLLRQNDRLGYTKTSNNGIRSGVSENVLLLNSDTVVPKGAIEKLCHALNTQENLGVVGPLSNAASTQSVPSIKGSSGQTAINALPGNLSPSDIDNYFNKIWDNELVRVPLVHGFCFMVKREVFEKIGLFDEESFPHGYGEENDFCFRVTDAGFDLAVLTNTYIYHAKSKSYASDERVLLMDAGMKALVRKYTTKRIERSVSTMQIHPKLEKVRIEAQKLYDEYMQKS